MSFDSGDTHQVPHVVGELSIRQTTSSGNQNDGSENATFVPTLSRLRDAVDFVPPTMASAGAARLGDNEPSERILVIAHKPTLGTERRLCRVSANDAEFSGREA